MARPSFALPVTDAGLWEWSARHQTIHIDVGTGDGRYALHLARREPSLGVVGLDTCLDHLAVHHRRVPANLRFVTADARAIPAALAGRAALLSINFPYSVLLTGLLAGDAALLESIAAALAPGGHLEVRINARALAETGHTLSDAGIRVERAFRTIGLGRITTTTLEADELRRFPSTWAKRIGFGRDPRAALITARMADVGAVAVLPVSAGRIRRARSLAPDAPGSVPA